jgi:peptide/nickel transport system substrate-binding protein
MRSLATRNPNYFKNGLPYVDEIEWFAITDGIARLNALLSGDVHMILELDPKALKRVASTPGVKAVSTPAGQYIDFVMMCDRAPTDNLDLRLGLKYLIDRERVVKSVYKGYAQMGNDTVVPPSDRFYCDSIPIRPYDLDKAKYHLKKSGVKEIELHTAEACGVGAIEQALMLQQAALKVDFKITIKRDPSDGYWSSTWMKFPFHMSGWSAKATSGIFLTITNKSDAPWNESQWKNKKFDQLLLASNSETDYAKRKEMYCEMQQLIYDTGGTIIPAFSDFIDGISEKVKGLKPLPLAGLGGLKFHETVWLS